MAKIVYTHTDEAPALATGSLLPIFGKFLAWADISVETADISLAGRILAKFPEYLAEDQRREDALGRLGNMVQEADANIIKLPNISASIPQLKNAIAELQSQGFGVPDFPKGDESDNAIGKIYSGILGSAVNPILREGNSDRRVAASVKNTAKANPHSLGAWSKNSDTHVSSMSEGDFYSSEQSVLAEKSGSFRIEFFDKKKNPRVLKDNMVVGEGDIVDSAVMSRRLLIQFFSDEMCDARERGLLLSLHLKATMMKISDPIIFGCAVETYFKDVFETYESVFATLGITPRNGLVDLYAKIRSLAPDVREEIERDIQACYEKGPEPAMVDSDQGITNFHVPNDIIIDASIPACIKNSGKMWGRDGTLKDTKALVPDRCYAGIYQEVIDFCKNHGAFDPTTMGNVSNVGLMAKKAEEYGSHDKTFEMEEDGIVRIIDDEDRTLMEHQVEEGDIFRVCETSDEAVSDWVKSAVKRSKTTGKPIVFWLDKQRAHDRSLIESVNFHLHQEKGVGDIDASIMDPRKAMKHTLERVAQGRDTISVTGNVLRDYLTDLFPILELGTSAKMLSIVRLLKGGGLFETGAGGTAPKHLRQFIEENHLRWDSLGEFLALSASLQDLAEKTNDDRVLRLAETLDKAVEKHLKNGKSPHRKVGEIDTRESHFYLALYWACELASVEEDRSARDLHQYLNDNEGNIVEELREIQGTGVDIGGHYHPCPKKVRAAMRPSRTFNFIVDQ